MKTFIKYSILFTLLFSVPFVFQACKDDEEPTPQVTVTADADTDQTVDVGEPVSLNGSGSSASDGSTLTYLWEFSSVPTGSTSSLSGTTSANASFTPDVDGNYMLQLTVASGTATDTDQVTITANPVQGGATDIAGSITTNTTLVDIVEDPTEPDYFASATVIVQAELTINPGVVIEFDEDVMINVTSSGAIIAEGSATDSVIFTSSNVAGGIRWTGIYIASSSALNSFSIARVSYAGNSEMEFSGLNYKAGIGVDNGGEVKVANTKLHRNDGYGLYIDDAEGELTTFADNVFDNNTTGVGVPANSVASLDGNSVFTGNTDEVEIFVSTFAETNTATWPALNASTPYRVTGNLLINGDLTIAPGAVFEMDEDVLITVNGAFISEGVSGNRIVYSTSDDLNSILWKGFYFSSADGRNSFDYSDISYAGNTAMELPGDNYEVALAMDDNGKISVTNSTISNNQGYGIYVEESGGQLDTFSGNTFENNTVGVGVPSNEVDALDGTSSYSNNTQAAVEILASTYADNLTTTWQALGSDAAYRVTSDITIAGELTIAGGADFVFDENVLVTVSGSLNANGTLADNITMTSSNVTGGLLWKGIYISSGSSLNSLKYVVLSYAGNEEMELAGTNYRTGVGVESTGKVSVTNSTFTDNDGYGLYIEESGGQIETFSDNVFQNNLQGVGAPADEIDAIDGNTTFSNNTQADVEIFGSTLDVSKTVTWNTLSNAASYRVTGNVNLDGTLTIEAGAIFGFDEDVKLEVEGALIADGTSGNLITFTSSNIAGGLNWKGIFIQSGNAQNLINFCEVSYSGNSDFEFAGTNFSANIGVNDTGQLTVTNSTISNSDGYGIFSKGTINNVLSAGNTFTANVSDFGSE